MVSRGTSCAAFCSGAAGPGVDEFEDAMVDGIEDWRDRRIESYCHLAYREL